MRQLSALVAKYKDSTTSVFRLSSAAVAAKTDDRTPRLSGSLAASWTANNGQPIARNVNINSDNPTPARNAISSVINSLNPGDTFSLANGQPYVRRVEYEGWSAKAPAGMMRISTAEWDSIVAESIRRAS